MFSAFPQTKVFGLLVLDLKIVKSGQNSTTLFKFLVITKNLFVSYLT